MNDNFVVWEKGFTNSYNKLYPQTHKKGEKLYRL